MRLRYLLLIIIPAIALTACGGNGDDDDGAVQVPEAEPTIRVGESASDTPTRSQETVAPATPTTAPTNTSQPVEDESEADDTGTDPLTTPGMTKGDPNAPVHLIEYGDYQ